jgi:hypothetical protein
MLDKAYMMFFEDSVMTNHVLSFSIILEKILYYYPTFENDIKEKLFAL